MSRTQEICSAGHTRHLSERWMRLQWGLFLKAELYVTWRKDPQEKPVFKGLMNTLFSGLLICTQGVTAPFDRLVATGELPTSLTHKMSQYHIETFSRCVKRKGRLKQQPYCLSIYSCLQASFYWKRSCIIRYWKLLSRFCDSSLSLRWREPRWVANSFRLVKIITVVGT